VTEHHRPASTSSGSGLVEELVIRSCGGADNDALQDLHGLENLSALTMLRVNENDALQSITAVPAGIGLKGIEGFNNPLLLTPMLADYAAQAGVDASFWLCNNGGEPAVCECIFIEMP